VWFAGFATCVYLSFSFLTEAQTGPAAVSSGGSAVQSVSNRPPVTPTPADGRIAYLTAKMLEQAHYLRQLFDDSVSSKFFDRYLEIFDPQHLHFTQEDIASFEYYRTNLDKLTVDPRRQGIADTTPACVIFNKFLERLAQRVSYVDELLQDEKFTFETEERVVVNREDLPYPNDLDEARKLWRDRLRFRCLTERLTKIAATKKKLEAAAKKPAPLNPRIPRARSLKGSLQEVKLRKSQTR
jgi:carboxyl-terminal processing protease